MNDNPPVWFLPLIAALSTILVLVAVVMGSIWLTGGFDPPGPIQPTVTCSSGPAQISRATELSPLTIICPDGKVYQP